MPLTEYGEMGLHGWISGKAAVLAKLEAAECVVSRESDRDTSRRRTSRSQTFGMVRSCAMSLAFRPEDRLQVHVPQSDKCHFLRTLKAASLQRSRSRHVTRSTGAALNRRCPPEAEGRSDRCLLQIRARKGGHRRVLLPAGHGVRGGRVLPPSRACESGPASNPCSTCRL